MLGLDRHAARYTWTAVFILLLVRLLYLLRETLFIFVVALLFAYLLWPLVKLLDRRLPGQSKVLALTLVYLALVGFLIIIELRLAPVWSSRRTPWQPGSPSFLRNSSLLLPLLVQPPRRL